MEIAKIGSSPPVIGAAGGSSPTTLREATQQFESLFVSQLMKSMRATVPESHLFGSESGQNVFRDMLDQEFASRAADSGGIGIGEMLYRQLCSNQKQAPDRGALTTQAAMAVSHPRDARPHATHEGNRSQNHED
jgi:peptidoglycan hydrolase FlgJ